MTKKENSNSEIRFGFGKNWLEFEGGGGLGKKRYHLPKNL